MNTTSTKTTSKSTSNTRRTGLAFLALAIGAPAITTHLPSAQAAPKAMAMATLSGTFVPVTHATRGTAQLRSTNGKRTVQLSGFSTADGPTLKVYLVSGSLRDSAGIKRAIAAGRFSSLGKLKALKGSQSYAVPASSKLGAGSSIVIWCDKFDVAFGSAPLA